MNRIKLQTIDGQSVQDIKDALQQNPDQSVLYKGQQLVKRKLNFVDDQQRLKILRDYIDVIVEIECKDGTVEIVYEENKFILLEDSVAETLTKHTFIMCNDEVDSQEEEKPQQRIKSQKRYRRPFSFE